MPKQSKKPYRRKRLMKYSKGSISFGFFILFVVIVVVGGIFSLKTPASKTPTSTQGYLLITQPPEPSRTNLQLKTISFISVTPNPLPPPNCSSTISDTVLIIDHSSTMKKTKLFKAKEAAKLFIDIVSTNLSSRVGLVMFDINGELLSDFTNDFTALKPLVDQIPESKGTCIQCGAKVGNEIMTRARTGVKKAAVLLSDGKANSINGARDPANAIQAALAEITSGHSASGIVYYTIGFGDGVNSMMEQAATLTGGTYHFAPTENELAAVFQQIASSICQ